MPTKTICEIPGAAGRIASNTTPDALKLRALRSRMLRETVNLLLILAAIVCVAVALYFRGV